MRGFSAELSYVNRMDRVVPAGSEIGLRYRYTACQLKSQSLIQMQSPGHG